jgi:hypothetical protein
MYQIHSLLLLYPILTLFVEVKRSFGRHRHMLDDNKTWVIMK